MTIISGELADRQGMPPLPSGWHYELHAFDAHVVHVVWPAHGAASVHFKHRTVATGWVIPGPVDRNKDRPGGKGWRAALVDEAVGLLQAAWDK